MLVSLNWLREFVPYEGDIQVLGDKLTMLGLELEGISDPFESVKDIVVGHVVERETHPESDHLSICTVDVGGPETLTIVCGAPNVAKGQNVPVAMVGSTMPDGMKIKKAKLRGVKSMGMICSERELGFSEDHEGIWVLDNSFTAGDKLVDALALERVVFDFDITPNRADCLSILGFARETALAFDLPLTMPELNLVESGPQASDEIKILIDDPELCPLFNGRVIRGVETRKSPDWMRFKLLALGQRPISNIVDVTNYIMFELGQPMHSYDLDLVEDATLRVAPATDGMKFTTLDAVERTLTANDLLIWDGKRPVGLAGVMGGANTEMHAGSTNVLLEAAIFRPGTIRKTARRLSLPSDASYRFERGVDQKLNRFCIDRAAQLMAEISGGTVSRGVVTNEPKPWQDRSHGYRHDRCMSLLGLDLEPEYAKKVFTLEGCTVDDSDPSNWTVASPSHRLDLEREVDLYEEVGRVYGLDRIPAVLPKVAKSLDTESGISEYAFIKRIKTWGAGVGLNEAINYSFVGSDDLDRLHLPEEGRVFIANPLSEDQNVMRTDLAPGLLNTLKNNLSQGNNHVRIFEVAKKFVRDADSETETRENARLGMLFYGQRHADEWPWGSEDSDYLDIKGHVEHLVEDCLKLEMPVFTLAPEHAYLEPCVEVTIGGTSLGFLGKVKADMADYYHARKDVWLADFDLDALRVMVEAHKIAFTALPVFPPSRRDVTVIGSATLHADAIRQVILSAGVAILESVELVAEFVPGGQEEERNLSFRLTYRSPAKTLMDKQVDKEHKKVLEALEKSLPVRF
ncbi:MULTISPECIES: phenylalanine--tRNA ligase subunit beta [unclassified Pseudodesulfovibrio]|uniref:phenylalanine--tRNA ligase subunit beta n=1 Tax=unclassified Pseudodesulfovibrio TaxID=2661612 RepID=UPI000FEC0A3A|nr:MULTISPECIES: phenylalanine--tRNA ligase subunit beta [unclassified Pseudodesulfovibrio]MCJ2165925.1 phenylalanine--tRNA ligase subunit beta [Pseudodesulfovibrio sp. S3-i]RWU02644.1 phenylalanine--tRNA ligase subunit beta [Pseudodesulfovibrio sp. S3]